MVWLYLIKESFIYAWHSLISNRVRTFLSLSGITIGIFAIISVFTVLDSLKNSIRESIATLGDDVIYIQKWPWTMGGDYPWWKYMKRPLPVADEAEKVRRLSKLADAVSFMVSVRKNVQHGSSYIENINIQGNEHDYHRIKTMDFTDGRYFTRQESASGRNRAVLGADIASELFPEGHAVGKIVKIAGKKTNVIGVLKKEGQDMFGLSLDKSILISLNYMRNFADIRNERLGQLILVKPQAKYSAEDLKAELTGIIRSIRRLKPAEDDNFALNQASLISQGFESIFGIVDLAGIIIGGFSILVGGFGIANIMFVSVKEQTRIIGIQKALGAKRFFILLQFLFEAVILALVGGLAGLSAVFVGTQIFGLISDMSFFMSAGNIVFGLMLSFSIGLVAGLAPAVKASKQDPVLAISAV